MSSEEVPAAAAAAAASSSSSSSSSSGSSSKLLDAKVTPFFPEEEERLLEYWQSIRAFETSVERSRGRPAYTFYDGPPFATGLPHYGHILAGTIKDVVTRWAHMSGFYVERRFGWDCHGLPIEFEIEKEHGIKTRDEVLERGIPWYNDECRKIVMRYAAEWRRSVTRMARWIDFDNDYKTMNTSFMESVWWVFRQLFDKGLVYRGYKVMPYSTACSTPLSNFEANMDYRMVDDPALTVMFQVKDDPQRFLLAWTTTPWTLPSNMALCVHPEHTYVEVLDKARGRHLIFSEALLPSVYPPAKKQAVGSELPYEIIRRMPGSELRGVRYVPLFPYFAHLAEKGAFRVLTDTYVTEETGTGVVHSAPGFGVDDYRICMADGVIHKGEPLVCPLDPNGRFEAVVTDFAGMYVKDADKKIQQYLKEHGLLFRAAQFNHSYPFCWRSETPLIYRAVPCWFVAVESIRDQLLANNEQTYWVPAHVKEKRFHNWLKDARDWAVSRNRFWGTPLPLWVSDDGEEVVCVGSIDELERLTGVRVTDLHRQNIDHLTIPSRRGPEYGVLKRVEEVFDCWFESGSMPYASRHYPFENSETFEHEFPADFIAEGVDQTRGWFYTLLVLSTALFGKPPFKNLIVNGLVLAADGKKMSKRLRNYPPPDDVISCHGADALRVYLVNSPVVRAEDLCFVEDGVKNVVRDVIMPWYSAYVFLVQNVHRLEKATGQPFELSTRPRVNQMDHWILAAVNNLIFFVKKEMTAYRLYTVIPRLLKFLDDFTNWYVKLNRDRMKGSVSVEDATDALTTMFEVLMIMCRLMSPFTPYTTELIYQNLRRLLPVAEQEDSVHYLSLPDGNADLVDEGIERAVSRMQRVIELGRAVRDRAGFGLKLPLASQTVIIADDEFLADVQSLAPFIRAELNVKELHLAADEAAFVRVTAQADGKRLGPRLGRALRGVMTELADLGAERAWEFYRTGKVTVGGHELTSEDVTFVKEPLDKRSSSTDGSVLVTLDLNVSEGLHAEYVSREFCAHVMKLRKKAGLQVQDDIDVLYVTSSDELPAKLALQERFITRKLRAAPRRVQAIPSDVLHHVQTEVGAVAAANIPKMDVLVGILPRTPSA